MGHIKITVKANLTYRNSLKCNNFRYWAKLTSKYKKSRICEMLAKTAYRNYRAFIGDFEGDFLPEVGKEIFFSNDIRQLANSIIE